MKGKKEGSASFSLERTLLANERTLLAYIRTAFSSFLLAVVLLKFLDGGFINYLGILFFVLSFIFISVGIGYYLMRKKKLENPSGVFTERNKWPQLF